MFERNQVKTIVNRINEKNNMLIEIIVGPRQTGKTTMLMQALKKSGANYIFKSVDEATIPTAEWLTSEWQQARNSIQKGERFIFAVDEIQKIPSWATCVKRLHDEDRINNINLKVFLSGSSSMLLQHGANESLMGRFELIRSPHWTYVECQTCFGYSLNEYLYFGGYPGAAYFKEDNFRWLQYMNDAIIQPTISQDVLCLEAIRKPSLMSNIFKLGATYSGQELSYNKMLGQLQEAGNTTTIASYLEILNKNNMICGIEKYSSSTIKRKKSSPKLITYDTGLTTAVIGKTYKEVMDDTSLIGKITESAVGAHLLKRKQDEKFDLFWYRKNNLEVDFVLEKLGQLTAIEVKSGGISNMHGMQHFLAEHPKTKRLVVGGQSQDSIPLEDFLSNKIDLF